jgi:transglutaminase/protease-like cytokinesis protein 3
MTNSPTTILCKWIILVAFPLFLSKQIYSENLEKVFYKTDQYAISIKGITDPKTLAIKLTSPFNTNLEKVRSIFRWMAENIAYDTKEYHLKDNESAYRKLFYTIPNTTKNLDSVYDYQLAKYVIRNKKGICEGYAVLFKILCDFANIKSEVIHGMAKNNIKMVGTVFAENNAWNAVMIDNTWKLLDVTWCSGYCDSNVTQFTRNFNDVYFLIAPNQMILNHWPTDSKWQLFPNHFSESQFFSFPLIRDGFFSENISSFYPLNGIVEAKAGNKIQIEIRTPVEPTDITVLTKSGNNEVHMKRQEKSVVFEYTITSDKEDCLDIFYNSKCIMSYRIVLMPK